MSEDFLAWVWKHQQFKNIQLFTTEGHQIKIIDPGMINSDSGPDYFNSRIIIDGIEWIGNVEIHNKSSEWYTHRHHKDPAYDNVILHLIYKNDQPCFDSKNRMIPALELKELIDPNTYSKYKRLVDPMKVISCKEQLHLINKVNITSWMDRLLVERLSVKVQRIEELHNSGIRSSADMLYHLLARNFGFGVNNEPFSMLARTLHFNILQKHVDSPFQMESLLFGQSGLINHGYNDIYEKQLLKEYDHFRTKYDLEPMNNKVWKFMRMRPLNFPTIRLSQLAALLAKIDQLNNHVLYEHEFDQLKSNLMVKASPYWNERYRFGEAGLHVSKELGKESVFNIIINSICPFLFWMGKTSSNNVLIDKAFRYARSCPPENNKITRLWNKSSILIQDGGDSQSAFHLVSNYCSKKKCLNCAWGTEILANKWKG